MDNKYEYLEKVNKLQQEAYRLDVESWFKYELFTFEWWVLFVLFTAPWVVFIKLADRSRILEILLFGSIIMITTTYLDAIGMQIQFWEYPTQFLPIAIRAIPFDMSVVPVLFMLLYQYFKAWKAYIIALFA
ncbi:CBO0543 family protein, partial [Virgibacillus sp. DJP39]|uniref:CBO0543 family protein n=1 Tax=Virgibacillus sp. DJP39 TaxID=3409790 RepID=UPI003BB6225F